MSFPLSLILAGWFLLAAFQHLLWKYQRKYRDAGVVDVGWAAGLGFLALLYAALATGDPVRRMIVGSLGGIWGFRLAYYLLRDRVIGKEEDGRYKALREHWGECADRNFIFFFQAQAALDVVLSIPFLVIAFDPRPELSGWVFVGCAVWLLSVVGETVADSQLAEFRSNPANKGKTCRRGLWRYSRHPNYFFEWMHWFSYALIAVGAPYAWAAWIGPLIMYVFITKFTGIPYTEKQALKSRGDDYRQYQATTNALIPWFPSTEAS